MFVLFRSPPGRRLRSSAPILNVSDIHLEPEQRAHFHAHPHTSEQTRKNYSRANTQQKHKRRFNLPFSFSSRENKGRRRTQERRKSVETFAFSELFAVDVIIANAHSIISVARESAERFSISYQILKKEKKAKQQPSIDARHLQRCYESSQTNCIAILCLLVF